MDLYRRIEALCRHRGLSVSAMCKASGAPRGSLGDLKHGRITGLSMGTLLKISEYLEVPISDLTAAEANDDLLELADLARTRPEVKLLLDTLKTADRAEVELTLRVLEAVKTADFR